MKKIISLILTVTMLFCIATPALTASAASGCVTIYVKGYGETLVNSKGEYIWQGGPVNSMMTGLKDVLDDLLKDLAYGALTGDYEDYCDRLYNAMAPAFSDLILDENGEASDGSGIGRNILTDPYHISYSQFSKGSIEFPYDWRLSSEYNAQLLEQFINRVCREKGYSKVNVLGRCLGGNVVSALLENADEATLKKINKVIMYVPSTEGVDFISALFAGEIVIDSQAVDNFVKYSLSENDKLTESIDDELMQTVITIVQFVNQAKILGVGTDIIEDILDAVKDNVLARIVRDSYGGFVGYWNMVTDEYLEKAIAFVYNTPELQEEYAEMIKKIRSYHENVQVNARSTTHSVMDKYGIDVMVISKYNYANFPLSKDAYAHSDNTALTSATSFGATVAKFGSTLGDKYISAMPEENLKYLSADKIIDASSCMLPENTWFIKNIIHDNFPASIDKLIDAFILNDNMNVFTNESYPQYMNYDKETGSISAVTGIDEDDIIKNDKQEKASIFIRFFTLVMNFFRKLFKGEIDFKNLFGGNEAA